MSLMITDEKIANELNELPMEMKKKVLDFACALRLSLPKGVSGKDFAKFSGTMDKRDITEIKNAIEDDCEQVSNNDW